MARRREIKRVYLLIRLSRQLDIRTVNRLRQLLILPFWVNHDNLRALHQLTQYLDLGSVAFTRTRLGKSNRVVVVQSKTIKKNQAIVVAVYTVKYSFI